MEVTEGASDGEEDGDDDDDGMRKVKGTCIIQTMNRIGKH
jgi:hypothetical protein